MNRRNTAVLVVVFALIAPLMVGCAPSLQARKVDVAQSVLVDPSILEKGKEGEALYRYVKPNVDWKMYSKVLVEPVIVYKEAAMDEETRQNFQTLANNAFVFLTTELAKVAKVVTAPRAGYAADTVRDRLRGEIGGGQQLHDDHRSGRHGAQHGEIRRHRETDGSG